MFLEIYASLKRVYIVEPVSNCATDFFLSQNWTLFKRNLSLYDESKEHTDGFVYRG
jgi:hypothetical protein